MADNDPRPAPAPEPEPAPDDEQPEIAVMVQARPDGKVHVELGAPTSWFSMDPESAVIIGIQMIQQAAVLQHMASSLETEGTA